MTIPWARQAPRCSNSCWSNKQFNELSHFQQRYRSSWFFRFWSHTAPSLALSHYIFKFDDGQNGKLRRKNKEVCLFIMREKILFVLVFTILLGSMQFLFKNAANSEMNHNNVTTIKALVPAEIAGLKFLQTKMQTPHGLIYYSVEHKSQVSYSVLESMGQAMEYAALIGNGELFDYYAKVTDTYFKDLTGYYYWQIDVATKHGETSSALVDDLRLVKAYFIAHENKLGKYDQQIKEISDRIFEFDINDGGYPCDYYDGGTKQKATTVSLFYLDVETLGKLSGFNNKWIIPYGNARDILVNMPENKYGFYPISFKTNSKRYVWGSSINMVENLYTAIDAYNAGKNTQALITFLKREVRKGKIYNLYNLDGAPADQNESTAVYALAARLLALNNEEEAAAWCYRRTLQFQIGDKRSLNGGFGEEDSGLVYAFDQLEALLMLRMVPAKYVSQ